MKEITVDFPLKGEWTAATTPGHKIPSHGTDLLGMTYAYDFVRLDWSRKGIHFHTKGVFQYLFGSVGLEDCPGWGQEIYSPFNGEVVEVIDGRADYKRLNFFKDTFRVLLNEITFTSKRLLKNYYSYTGNYIVLKGKSCYAAFAHIKKGSVAVCKGQIVRSGQLLAQVGHSGNSSAPHLHFQLMDNPDITKANGLPCCFAELEFCDEGNKWKRVTNNIPQRWQKVRAINA